MHLFRRLSYIHISRTATLVLFAAMFALAAHIAYTQSDAIAALVAGRSTAAYIAFIGLNAAAVIVAPLSTFPLIPLTAAAWGWPAASIALITGWTLGAAGAFLLARQFGRPLAARYISMRTADDIADLIAGPRPLLTVILLRMILPVEVLSYALGIFGSISFRTYIAATAVGIAPGAVIFSYASKFPPAYQLVVVGVIVMSAALIYRRLLRRLRTRVPESASGE